MDHPTALRSQAVERYTLGELTSPEREAFEEHFFDCPECIDALREYEIFAANTRAVFREDAKRAGAPVKAPGASGWLDGIRQWFAIPAVALVGLVAAVVMLRAPSEPVPDPSGPRVEWAMLPDARAGEVPHQKIAAGVIWLAPSIRLQGADPQRWMAYLWEVRGAEGGVIAHGEGHGAGVLRVKIPVSKVAFDKTYRLTVQGSPGTAPVVSSFVIEHN